MAKVSHTVNFLDYTSPFRVYNGRYIFFIHCPLHNHYTRGNVLLRKFHMCSMSVKIQLFNTYCSPMYIAQLWWNHTVASFHCLNVAYNNVLRRLLRRPRFCSASGLFAECRIPNCKAVIRNLIFRFMTRLDLSTNSTISTILVSDIRWTSRIRRHWVKSLYGHHNLVW